MDNKIVLIGGTGRSGTNITKKLLSFSPDSFALPFEQRFIIDPDGIVDFYNSFSTWSPYVADKKIKRLENYLLRLSQRKFLRHAIGEFCKKYTNITPDRYHGWELEKWFPGYETYVKEMIEELKSFEYIGYWPGTDDFTKNNKMYFSDLEKEKLREILGKFLEKTINSALKKQKKKVFIEDNTWNILFAKELFELMPNAKLIHVVRDPRDVVASLIRQRWAPNELKKAIRFYKSIIFQWQNTKKHLPKNRLLEIKFEDMVANQENMIKKICKFTGMKFDKKMLILSKENANIGRWKKDFNSKEMRVLHDELVGIIRGRGYEF